jgi:hypothetical protein
MDKNEPAEVYGPRRRAPHYYAGESRGRHVMNYPDVERYPNGALAGRRDKLARRVIRAAFGRHFSSVEKGIKFARALKAQAYEVAPNGHAARRLLAAELAIHQTVYAPSQKELRALRTERRKLKRQGKLDAIGQLVEKMASK